MKHYRYDMIGADLDYHIQEHPQAQMNKLGLKVIKSEPVPIGDCWWFRTENSLSDLPGYLSEMSDDFKFSDEYHEQKKVERDHSTEVRTPPTHNPDGTLTDYGRFLSDHKWIKHMKD